MNKNFLKITFRNLWKNKLYSIIKIGGLGVSLATGLLVALFLHHELSFDAFHERADRIVRTTMEYQFSGELETSESTGNMVGPTFKAELPEVEDQVRVISYEMTAEYQDRLFEETAIYFADPSFFSIFSFPIVQGAPDNLLEGPNEVVITEKMAAKYFGAEDPVGRQIQLGGSEYRVQAVMADAPANSQLQPHFVGSFLSLRDAHPERATWWNANYATYLLLQSPGALHPLEQKIDGYMRSKEREHGAMGADYLTYHFEPLRDVYLRSPLDGNFVPAGDIRYLVILGFAALIVLLIASITYINLTTATSSARAREIGVSKVIGATRMHLFRQFIGESVVATGLALVLGIALSTVGLSLFSELLQRELTWQPLLTWQGVLSIALFSTALSVFSGIYPAVVLSSYQPVKVLKGRFTHSKSGNALRKSLIVAQFSISVFLIICTGVLFMQMQYIQNRSLGYEGDQLIVLPSDGRVSGVISTLKSELTRNSAIQAVSLAYETPVYIQGGYRIAKSVTGEDSKPVTALPADADFITATGIELAAGSAYQERDVELSRQRDSTRVPPILINASQAAAFGWTPEEAVNQFAHFQGRQVRILGVMKDFHFASLHVPIDNLVVFPSDYGQDIMVRISSQDLQGTLQYMEGVWEEVVAHRPFSFHFMSDEIQDMYHAETLIARLITALAGIALFMTVIGLFGLTAIATQHRTKEIGIRKVLGASAVTILSLLSSDMLKLTAVALAGLRSACLPRDARVAGWVCVPHHNAVGHLSGGRSVGILHHRANRKLAVDKSRVDQSGRGPAARVGLHAKSPMGLMPPGFFRYQISNSNRYPPSWLPARGCFPIQEVVQG